MPFFSTCHQLRVLIFGRLDVFTFLAGIGRATRPLPRAAGGVGTGAGTGAGAGSGDGVGSGAGAGTSIGPGSVETVGKSIVGPPCCI